MEQQLMSSLQKQQNFKDVLKQYCYPRRAVQNQVCYPVTACKVANSKTVNLGKNPETVNSPDERKTSVNSKPSNS